MRVEARSDGIVVYVLDDQAPDTLARWVERVQHDLNQVRAGRARPDRPHRVLHDLRRCASPRSPLLAQLRAGLIAGHDLAIHCAVVAQDALTAQILEQFLGIPDMDGSQTPRISSPELAWAARAEVRFFDDYLAAVAWLSDGQGMDELSYSAI